MCTRGSALGLAECRQQLLNTLSITEVDENVAGEIVRLHTEEILPRENSVWLSELSRDERREAICGLSQSLDLIEETVGGPLLAGNRCTIADAMLFPSMALLEQTLVPRFGWTEWTEEALFYRRPRLHAWWELMHYEDAAVRVEELVTSKLQDMSIDWDQIAFDVPTSRIRKFPAHTR